MPGPQSSIGSIHSDGPLLPMLLVVLEAGEIPVALQHAEAARVLADEADICRVSRLATGRQSHSPLPLSICSPQIS